MAFKQTGHFETCHFPILCCCRDAALIVFYARQLPGMGGLADALAAFKLPLSKPILNISLSTFPLDKESSVLQKGCNRDLERNIAIDHHTTATVY